MRKLKVLLSVITLSVFVFGVAVVSAQDTGNVGRDVMYELLGVVVAETGVTEQEIITQLQEGLTAAEIITANGGDVDAVAATANDIITARVTDAVAEGNLTQERADQLLVNVDTVIERALEGTLRSDDLNTPRIDSARALLDATAAQTGLDPQEVLQSLRDGQTLNELVTANGGDVDAVIQAASDVANTGIEEALAAGRITQEQADELAASLPQVIDEAINGQLNLRELRQNRREERGERGGERMPMDRDTISSLLSDSSDLTGLSQRDLLSALSEGQTLAEILTDNGVNVDDVIALSVTRASDRLAEVIAQGRITQERADEIVAELETRLAERINQPLDRNRQ